MSRLPVISEGPAPSYQEVEEAVSRSVDDAVSTSEGKIGILLSGGVDSTVLLRFALRHGKIPVFTVVTDLSHPDLEAAKKVAEEYGLKHYVLMPGKEDLDRAYEAIGGREGKFKGDAAVYLALELAKEHGVDTILTSDGIDELVGGYWWHANESDRFTSKEATYRHFWDSLEENHISPMLRSADIVGIEVKYPFLDEEVISVLSRVPIESRTEGGITKKWWKDFASEYISPEIATRPKLGFLDSLEESISVGSDLPIWWEADYAVDSTLTKSPRRLKSSRKGRLPTRTLKGILGGR